MNRISIRNCDANRDIDEILKLVNPNRSLTVAFVDPNGLDIHYSTLKRLSTLPKLDVILNFGVSDLKRNFDRYRSGQHEKANLFFGCEDWPVRSEDRLPFYRDRLKALGFSAVEDNYEQTVKVQTHTKADIYYLIFAGKHELSLHFWRDAKKKYLQRGFDLS